MANGHVLPITDLKHINISLYITEWQKWKKKLVLHAISLKYNIPKCKGSEFWYIALNMYAIHLIFGLILDTLGEGMSFHVKRNIQLINCHWLQVDSVVIYVYVTIYIFPERHFQWLLIIGSYANSAGILICIFIPKGICYFVKHRYIACLHFDTFHIICQRLVSYTTYYNFAYDT